MVLVQFALRDIPNTECGGISKVACNPFVAEKRETGQLVTFIFTEFRVNKLAWYRVKPELLICTVTPPKELAVGLVIRMLSVVAV